MLDDNEKESSDYEYDDLDDPNEYIETIQGGVETLVQGTHVQGDFCPRRELFMWIFVQGDSYMYFSLSKKTVCCPHLYVLGPFILPGQVTANRVTKTHQFM